MKPKQLKKQIQTSLILSDLNYCLAAQLHRLEPVVYVAEAVPDRDLDSCIADVLAAVQY